MKRRRSLKSTIIICNVILVLIGSISFFLVGITNVRLTVKRIAMNDMSSQVNSLNSALYEKNKAQFDLIHSFSGSSFNRDAGNPLTLKQQQLDEVVAARKGDINRFIITDKDGNTVMMVNGKNEDLSARRLYQEAMAGREAMNGPVMEDGQLLAHYVAPVYDMSGKNVIHTMGLSMSGEFVNVTCQEMQFGKTGAYYVFDVNTGTIVGATDVALSRGNKNVYDELKHFEEEGQQEFLEGIKSGSSGSVIFRTGVNNGQFLSAYAPVEGTSWVTLLLVDFGEYLEITGTMEDLFFGIIVGFLVSGIVVSIVLGRSLKFVSFAGKSINDIASGEADLTKRLTVGSKTREIRDVVDGFNNFVAKLQTIVATIKSSNKDLVQSDEDLVASTQDTLDSIDQIMNDISSVNDEIGVQGSAVLEVSDAVNEIAASIKSLERLIDKQGAAVGQASSAVEEMVGNIDSVDKSVGKMVGSFGELESNAKIGISTQADVNERIKQIEEQSQMLQDANSAIASIAEQTNLLAMNAAIEAAHAGEAGKGFSVVADEIRKLSETSSSQSKTIGDELKKIQESILAVADASTKASVAFNNVSDNLTRTDQVVHQIKSAMEEQQIGSKQIIDALHAMNDSTSEVKAASVEMEIGNNHIIKQMQNLQHATGNMQDKIKTMNNGATKISETGGALHDISSAVSSSIKSIGNEIDSFKV